MEKDQKKWYDAPPRPALFALLSLILHVGYALSPFAARAFLPMDEGRYWDLAAHLAREGRLCVSEDAFATVKALQPTLFWTPGYPLFLALVLKAGFGARAVVLLQAAMAASLPLFLWPLLRRFFRGAALWIALAVAAFYPYYFQLSSQVGSETLALFLGAAALMLAAGGRGAAGARTEATTEAFTMGRASPWRLAALGTLCAWLSLTRPEYLVFAVVLMAWTLAARGGGRSGAAALLAAFALWMGLWLGRNYEVTRTLTFTTRSGYSLVYQNEYYRAFTRGETGSEEEWLRGLPGFPTEMGGYRYLKKRGRDFILSHPRDYAVLCAKRVASLAAPAEAKALLYRLAGRKDFHPARLPFAYRWSNLFFLIALWALAVKALAARPWKRGLPWSARDPEGLMILLAAGQLAVFALFAYVEYQRSVLDLELLMGAWALSATRGPGAYAPSPARKP